MARPRRDEQEVLLLRISTALESRDRLEPWTLAEIAPVAGLSPPGLLKRFGSRQGVLLALSRRWIDSIPDGVQDRDAPCDELRGWVERRFAGAGPRRVAVGLVNLLDDLVDEELRAALGEGWAKEIRYLASLLRLMDLAKLNDPDSGAEVLFDALNGAMLRQATRPDSPLTTRILDDLLEAWT
jgi:AcrR family transcriptional regulator